MVATRSAMVLALCALTTGLAGCTALGGPDVSGEDGPLQVGATWRHAGVTHGIDFEQTSVVTAEVERHGERAFQVESRSEYGKSPTHHFVTSWLRVDDLAILEAQMSRYGTMENGIAVDDRSRSLFPIPCPDEFGRDLAVGMEWPSACTVLRDSTDWSSSRGYSSMTYNHTRTATYRVVGVENVTVPAGTFAAYRVTRTSPGEDEDLTTTMWVSEQACGPSRHPVVKSAGEDIHAEITMELVHHDCQSLASPPWKGEGPRRWAPPVKQPMPGGWPEDFAPSLDDLGGKFVLAPASRSDDGRTNPALVPVEGNGYDDTGPVEAYYVRYEVKGNPSDAIRVTATRFENASHAQQFADYPIHRPDYECGYYPKVLLIVGVVVVQLDGSYEPHDGKDTTVTLARGILDATAVLERRFGVDAGSCDWSPEPETHPTNSGSSSSSTGGP